MVGGSIHPVRENGPNILVHAQPIESEIGTSAPTQPRRTQRHTSSTRRAIWALAQRLGGKGLQNFSPPVRARISPGRRRVCAIT